MNDVGIYNGNRFDIPLVDLSTPRCILTIDHETVTSQYNYTLSTLHKVLNSEDWREYIKDGDYIKLITNNDDDEFTMEFNIDPYYGDTSIDNTHHIDMISKELIQSIGAIGLGMDQNYVGQSTKIKSPYLISNIYSTLSSYYTNIPEILKTYIISKSIKAPYKYYDYTRHTSGSGNTSSSFVIDLENGFISLNKLWVPYAHEVTGSNPALNEKYMSIYSTLSNINKRIKTVNNTAYSWWTASHYDGNKIYSTSTSQSYYDTTTSRYWYYINDTGSGNADDTRESRYVPLCFRFV